VTRGQLPQRAGSLGLTAVGLPPRYPQNAQSTHINMTKMLIILHILSWGLENKTEHCDQKALAVW